MNSTYYAGKIKEFETAKSEIAGLSDSLSDCQSSVANCCKIMETLTICGEAMDQGKTENMGKELQSIEADFDAIITECNNKIEKYQQLYEKAKAAEEEAAKRQTTSN